MNCLFACLFVFFSSTPEVFSYMETSALPVKGCTFPNKKEL